MTAQAADSLDNQYPGVDLDGLMLYRILVGPYEEGERYPFRTPPVIPSGTQQASFLWRKHIAEFTLDSAGQLMLEAYSYPLSPGKPREVVGERLVGDFWLELRFRFQGPKVFVPFQAGVIVAEETAWKSDDARPLDELRRLAKADAL